MEEDDLSFDFEENLTQQQLQQQHLKEQAQQEQQRNRVQQESTHTQALAQTDGGFAGAPGNQAAGSNPRRPLKQVCMRIVVCPVAQFHCNLSQASVYRAKITYPLPSVVHAASVATL